MILFSYHQKYCGNNSTVVVFPTLALYHNGASIYKASRIKAAEQRQQSVCHMHCQAVCIFILPIKWQTLHSHMMQCVMYWQHTRKGHWPFYSQRLVTLWDGIDCLWVFHNITIWGCIPIFTTVGFHHFDTHGTKSINKAKTF